MSQDQRVDRQPVRRFRPDPHAPPAPDGEWPLAVPAIAQILREGLELPPGATVLVGEPGSLDLIVERSPGADRWAYFLRDE